MILNKLSLAEVLIRLSTEYPEMGDVAESLLAVAFGFPFPTYIWVGPVEDRNRLALIARLADIGAMYSDLAGPVYNIIAKFVPPPAAVVVSPWQLLPTVAEIDLAATRKVRAIIDYRQRVNALPGVCVNLTDAKEAIEAALRQAA